MGFSNSLAKHDSLPAPPLTLLTPPLELTADPWLLPDISQGRKAQSPFTESLTCSAVRAVDRGEAKHVEKIEAPHSLPITSTHPLIFPFTISFPFFFPGGNI